MGFKNFSFLTNNTTVFLFYCRQQTNLLEVTGDIRAGIEDASVTVLALVDFLNAFNTVSLDILLSILSHFMISSDALEWFSNYLHGRQQSVRLNESSSS